MIDRALELGNAAEGAPDVPLDDGPLEGLPVGPDVPDSNV